MVEYASLTAALALVQCVVLVMLRPLEISICSQSYAQTSTPSNLFPFISTHRIVSTFYHNWMFYLINIISLTWLQRTGQFLYREGTFITADQMPSIARFCKFTNVCTCIFIWCTIFQKSGNRRKTSLTDNFPKQSAVKRNSITKIMIMVIK